MTTLAALVTPIVTVRRLLLRTEAAVVTSVPAMTARRPRRLGPARVIVAMTAAATSVPAVTARLRLLPDGKNRVGAGGAVISARAVMARLLRLPGGKALARVGGTVVATSVPSTTALPLGPIGAGVGPAASVRAMTARRPAPARVIAAATSIRARIAHRLHLPDAAGPSPGAAITVATSAPGAMARRLRLPDEKPLVRSGATAAGTSAPGKIAHRLRLRAAKVLARAGVVPVMPVPARTARRLRPPEVPARAATTAAPGPRRTSLHDGRGASRVSEGVCAHPSLTRRASRP